MIKLTFWAVFIILTPLMLICGVLSWKLIQLMEQEKKDKRRKGWCISKLDYINQIDLDTAGSSVCTLSRVTMLNNNKA